MWLQADPDFWSERCAQKRSRRVGILLQGTLALQVVKSIDSLELDSLLLVLESASHASVESAKVEDLAFLSLHRLHKNLHSMTPNQLATLSKIISGLYLEAEDFLIDFFSKCADSVGELDFHQLSVICLGIGSLSDDVIQKLFPCMESLASHSMTYLGRGSNFEVRDLLWVLFCFSRHPAAKQREASISGATQRLSALLKNSLDDLSFEECVSLVQQLHGLGVEDWHLFSEAEELLARKRYDQVAEIDASRYAPSICGGSASDPWYCCETSNSM